MDVTPLHGCFGVEVTGVELRAVTAGRGYGEIRAAFEEHSLLLFRGQDLDDEAQLAFARLFGPLEDRQSRLEPIICPVSNVRDDGSTAPADALQTRRLIANQLWHTDSTFLPVPALANVCQARVVPSEGGETEFVSTRAGWQELDPALREQARGAVLWHSYRHSRSKIDRSLAAEEMITKWCDQAWRAVWPNPANGAEALYIASHAFAVDGMAAPEGTALIERLTAAVTGEDAVYRHRWQPGDVIVWDERATLHRGQPWPYDQPRTLMSICVSARDCDGLARVRPG